MIRAIGSLAPGQQPLIDPCCGLEVTRFLKLLGLFDQILDLFFAQALRSGLNSWLHWLRCAGSADPTCNRQQKWQGYPEKDPPLVATQSLLNLSSLLWLPLRPHHLTTPQSPVS